MPPAQVFIAQGLFAQVLFAQILSAKLSGTFYLVAAGVLYALWRLWHRED